MSGAAPPYRHIAWCYDAISTAYSLGTIDRAKACHHRLIEPGTRVLYAGAGTGREIAGALSRGARVTCIEPCPAMVERLHNRLAQHGERFVIVPRPIQAVAAQPEYDIVVSHFFLNLFNPDVMPGVLSHLCGFIKHGGRIVIADFKPAEAGAGGFERLLRWLYYTPPHRVGQLLRICEAHPIYDYAPLMQARGLHIAARHAFNTVPGFAGYETLIAHRPAATPA